MRPAQEEMDLEEWELLPSPKNSFNDLDHDEDHHRDIVMDYFLCPSTQEPLQKIESPPGSRVVPTKLLQVPIAWEPVLDHDNKMTPNDPVLDTDPNQTLDSVLSPTLSFKKMKETEFADMKIDPPAKITSHVSLNDAATSDDDVTSDHDGEKSNLWKIGLNRLGSVCSFGVAAAAATVCVLFLGHNNIKVCKNKNQMLRFQIYSDDNKRMREVVNHESKVNETIFAMKGVPVVRAQISFGGYYDGL